MPNQSALEMPSFQPCDLLLDVETGLREIADLHEKEMMLEKEEIRKLSDTEMKYKLKLESLMDTEKKLSEECLIVEEYLSSLSTKIKDSPDASLQDLMVTRSNLKNLVSYYKTYLNISLECSKRQSIIICFHNLRPDDPDQMAYIEIECFENCYFAVNSKPKIDFSGGCGYLLTRMSDVRELLLAARSKFEKAFESF